MALTGLSRRERQIMDVLYQRVLAWYSYRAYHVLHRGSDHSRGKRGETEPAHCRLPGRRWSGTHGHAVGYPSDN